MQVLSEMQTNNAKGIGGRVSCQGCRWVGECSYRNNVGFSQRCQVRWFNRMVKIEHITLKVMYNMWSMLRNRA